MIDQNDIQTQTDVAATATDQETPQRSFLNNVLDVGRKYAAPVLLTTFLAGALSSCATTQTTGPGCKAPIGHKGSKSSAQHHNARQVWGK